MTGNEDWTVDGVSLNPAASNIYMRTWNGLDTIPGVNVTGSGSSSGGTAGNIQLAQTHGEFWYPKYFTAATKTITMFVSSLDASGNLPTSTNQGRQNFDTNLDMLSKLFSRRRQLMTIVRTLSSGSQRMCLAEVADIMDPSLIPVTQGLLTVGIVIPDAFWRDPTDTTLVSGITPASNIIVLSGATAPMNDLEFKITGPITNPRVTDNESGSWFQYNGTIGSGQTLNVFNSTMSISGAGASLINMSHAGDSNWLTLYPTQNSPGGVSINFTGSGTTGATALAIFGHMKYLR